MQTTNSAIKNQHICKIVLKIILFWYGMIAMPDGFAQISTSHLSLPILTQIALTHNKDLLAARCNIAIAASRLTQAGLFSNPTLNLINTDDRFFSRDGEYTRSIGLSQDFPIAGRIAAQQQVARVDVVLAEAEIQEAERKLEIDVATNYYALVVLNQRIHLINQLLINAGQLVKITHNRLHAAEISEIDANTAQLEYQRLLQEKNLLLAQRATQKVQLNQLLGQSSQLPLHIEKSIPQWKSIPLLTILQNRALQRRPDFNALWLSLNRARAETLLAHSKRFADWTLSLAVQQNRQVLDNLPPQKTSRAMTLSLAVPLPLFNDGKARIQETTGVGIQAEAQLMARRLSIEAEVAGNYAELKILQRAFHQARQKLLPLSSRNLQLSKNAYVKGQISLLDVLQLQRQQSDLQTVYLNTLEKYCQAWVKLKTSIGERLSHNHLVKIQ